jgi:hypothetical protein
MDAKKIINKIYHDEQKYRTDVDRRKKELRENESRHLNESEGEQPEQLYTMNARQQKQNLATTEEDMENHEQRIISVN